MISLILFILFILLILIGVPISFAMGSASVVGFYLLGGNFQIIPTKMFTGIDNFTFMAIPLFVLASDIMSAGDITKRIVQFCNHLVGHVRGGLAHVNILSSMLFAGITGSATADAAGLGSIEIEMMREAGYNDDFSAGVTAASAIIGPIIPPSTVMIIYAVVAGNVSVISLFLGGIIPGIILGVALMVISYFIARKNNYPKKESRSTLAEIFKSFIATLPATFMPLIIIGGILLGIFTATEAAAVAVLYSVIIAKYVLKTFRLRALKGCLIRTAKTTSLIFFIIAIASSMAWVVTALQIPQTISAFFLQYANSKFLFLIMANILLLIVGTMLDLAPALLIMVPVLLPVAIQFGIDPIHFGVLVAVNLCLGLITPPIGMVLFITANVAKIRLSNIYKSIMPFLLAELVVLIVLTFIPSITLAIPHLFGY
jgi:tripartite ATP-independent transporter DctM subunit